MAKRTALAIRHVAFEDLGSFETPISAAGFDLQYHDIATAPLAPDLPLPDLLIVLGGPIGAYEESSYPFILNELDLLERQMASGGATLGICLGAQLMARALGARVYPGPEKEIGWKPVDLTTAGKAGPLRHLNGAAILHWHGDTFDLPPDCELLASTSVCHHQAFAKGRSVLGLQFHPEISASRLEHWLVGHACELAQQNIFPGLLREQAATHAGELATRSELAIEEWLAGLAQ